MEVPLATESERGIASVALNNPKTVLNVLAEKRFSTRDIFDPLSKFVVETILDQSSRSGSTDIRVVFEKVRERLPELKFHELSELYTLMPIESALPELLEAVKHTAKRRELLAVMQQTLLKIKEREVKTIELLNHVTMQVDAIQNDLTPPIVSETKKLLMDAIERYQEGDDETQRIKTGFEKVDNLTPIRFGDFVVIGGETKSGKTMFALNIIANLIK